MRIIPIANTTITLGACEDAEGIVPKQNIPLARRDFLKGSGVLMGVLAAGTTFALLAPSPVWAVELKSLSQAEGVSLMKLGRVLYPHEKLPDAVYALLAKDLDGAASASSTKATELKAGIAALDKACDGNFANASDAKKEAAVKAIEGSAFFSAVRGQCITSLYDNDMAYVAFGYPGASWDKAGYLMRGFQDLKWLPAPPETDSPAPYIG
jgi:hypothetical protein